MNSTSRGGGWDARDPEWVFAAKHVLYPQYDGPEGAAEDYFTGILGCEGGKNHPDRLLSDEPFRFRQRR